MAKIPTMSALYKKLATYDLFENTLQSLNIEENKIYILDTLKYKFSKQKKNIKGNKANNSEKYDLQKALKITQNYQTISELNPEYLNVDFRTKLINYSQISKAKNNKIDQGEVTLINHVCYLNQQENNNYLLTGDKKCLRALSNSGMIEIINLLEGKVWCLEQLILRNIEQFGFNLIQDLPKKGIVILI